jgi:hypothetical protein
MKEELLKMYSGREWSHASRGDIAIDTCKMSSDKTTEVIGNHLT